MTSDPEPLHRVMESCLYAHDLEAAERFYTKILGLELITREEGRHVFFRCGRGVVLVFNPAKTESEQSFVDDAAIPVHGAHGPGHLAFAVDREQLTAWRARLEQEGMSIGSRVSWPDGRGESIYIRDPAGNSIELVTPELWAPKTE